MYRSPFAAAGLAVVFFTLVSSMLLVVRDVLLARWFGLGNELDAFFVALIVPMFLVTVLSMPIGTVMVPSLLGVFERGREKAQELITACSTVILCGMTALCLIVLVSAGSYLPVVGWGFPAGKILQSRNILMMVLPLLFFSGFVILGNSILNARQRFALPAFAQAAVPVVAILTLYLLARWIGIYAMAIGTCLGQVVNLLVVCRYVRREGFSMLPELRPGAIRKTIRRSSERLKGLLAQYAPLVFSSLFVSVALPVNNAIAASLSAGSVSAFNLGTKFIVFFTGLISTGVSTVMLPYFSSYFVSDRIGDARRELSLFLFLGTVVPIPLTLIVFFFTGSIVRFIFGGGAFSAGDTATVTAVIEYGMVQLPFFCTNMLFSRFANARQKNALIMISSLVGLVLNIVLNFVFIRYMGLAGISLAVSVSMIGATVLFVVVGRRYNDITWIDVAFLGITWFLYLTILLCFHFGSMLNVIVTSAVLLLVILNRLVELLDHRAASTDFASRC
ncbi:MAG: putative peptidoglycan biosynthesis protein MurJ [Syntrophorhabdus sp. PtaB.Bin047]|nr:MAG: putative peptidoglycan biosynthesis protein MurJ [Syntrophorhabdus sp. PtaB.Bin047]